MAPIDTNWPSPYIENVSEGEEVFNVRVLYALLRSCLASTSDVRHSVCYCSQDGQALQTQASMAISLSKYTLSSLMPLPLNLKPGQSSTRTSKRVFPYSLAETRYVSTLKRPQASVLVPPMITVQQSM